MPSDDVRVLGRELRKFLEFPVTDEASLTAFHEETERFEALLQKVQDAEVPHFLWHWLSDADIRLKDSDYAHWQNHHILLPITAWEAGNPPPASVSRAHGITIPLAPAGVPPAAWGKFVGSVSCAIGSSTFEGGAVHWVFALADTTLAVWGLRSKPRWLAVVSLVICGLAALNLGARG